MSIEEIRSRISVINAETSRINNQRNQNIGRQETLKKQLRDAFVMYEKNYGVKLTAETLEQELQTVTSKKEEELNKIEQILTCINEGNIDGANKLAGVSVEPVKEEIATPIQSEVVTPSNTEPEPSVIPPIVEPPKVAPPKIAEPPKVAPPKMPTSTPEPPKVAPPKMPMGTLSGIDTLGGTAKAGMPALDGFTKNSLGSLPTPQETTTQPQQQSQPQHPVQDFNAILNGTAFGQK